MRTLPHKSLPYCATWSEQRTHAWYAEAISQRARRRMRGTFLSMLGLGVVLGILLTHTWYQFNPVVIERGTPTRVEAPMPKLLPPTRVGPSQGV